MVTPQRYAYGKVRTRQGDGDWDYFPYGWLGRGYRVNETELARLIRLEHGRSRMAVLAAIWVVASVVIGAVFRDQIERSAALLAGAAVAGSIMMAWFAVVVARRTRWLAPAERPLTWMELRRWEASVLSGWRLLFLIGAAGTLTALGLLFTVRAAPEPALDRVVLGTGLGLLCFAIGCYGFAKIICVLWFRFQTRRLASLG
jgi:hypothetical protein